LNVPYESQRDLEAAWQKLIPKTPEGPMHFPNPKIPLAIAAISGLILVEDRKRYVRRAIRYRSALIGGLAATRNLAPEDSLRLMQWAAFGGPDSQKPSIMGYPASATPGDISWRNVPVGTLREVAKSGLPDAHLTRRQNKGLRKTAAHVLKYGDLS
jgi:hypothetical protein